MALKAGSLHNSQGQRSTVEWQNSMAEAMEKAFMAAWPRVMGNQPTPDVSDQMRLLFIAIAQGVVRHLVDNAEAFAITIENQAGHTHTVGDGQTGSAGSHRHMASIEVKHASNRVLF